MQPSAAPIPQSERTAIIDMLRGWALLGVVVMNYVDHYYLGIDKTVKPGTASSIMMGLS
jgi:uncharacterized protein